MWVDIMAVREGLFVHGSISPMLFKQPNVHPRTKVSELGKNPKLCDYVLGRADEGMSGLPEIPSSSWTKEKAVQDLQNDEDPTSRGLLEALSAWNTQDEMLTLMKDPECLFSAGVGPSKGLKQAHAAVHKLHCLLLLEELAQEEMGEEISRSQGQYLEEFSGFQYTHICKGILRRYDKVLHLKGGMDIAAKCLRRNKGFEELLVALSSSIDTNRLARYSDDLIEELRKGLWSPDEEIRGRSQDLLMGMGPKGQFTVLKSKGEQKGWSWPH